jgi:ribonuclease HII
MRLAAQKVYQKLLSKYGDTDLVLLIDGNMNIGSEFIEEPIVKGDSKIKAIAAASILAKVARDRLMLRLDEKYADYGFKVHKGYPTVVHKERVRLLGPSRVHRLTFRGVKEHISPFQRS